MTAATPGSPPSPVPRLSALTTLRVGGPPLRYVETATQEDLIDAVRTADEAGEPVLVLGGGSNVLVADEGFPGLVVKDARSDIAPRASSSDDVTCRVAAGTPWDAVVEETAGHGWCGLEALSGIPGSAGATPVQNVGAYGQEVAQAIASVRVWDRAQARVRTLAPDELAFGYRTSLLKRSMRASGADPRAPWTPTPRFVVLDMTFRLRPGPLAAQVRYPELARVLEIAPGGRAPLADVRAAVLELRARKGMLLDAADHDTWSAGSFFTNPVLPPAVAAGLPDDAPRYPAAGGVKTSAAWLIAHAGFAPGFGAPGPATVSTKHTLALTNRGTATAGDVLALARTISAGVAQQFGITLEPEPVLVGVSL